MSDVVELLTAALADRYAIQEELGAGGMATVYLAEDLKHHRKVAVKVLRPELAAVLGAERFLKEIEVTATLRHPHILPLFDSGEAAGFLYYVMPYVDGESLRVRMNRDGQIPVDEAVTVAREVGDALTYAHSHGVVHRDIKPENVLMDSGHAVVADFGIATALSEVDGERMTQTGMSLGTPHYMSPEQAAGERDLDGRSDLYALACIVYEMLVGDPPFTGGTAQAVIAKRLTDAAPRVTARRDSVPAAIDAAIARALARAPEDRFPGVGGFLEELERPAPVRRAGPSIVVLPFANLSPDPDNEYFADGLMEEVIADLSKVRSLRVISRNSAIQLKGTTKDTRTIGRDLGVQYVLEGSVRKAGNKLRITAQLIEAENDTHLWADKYNGTVDDVFDLQERLSRQIVDALRVELTPEEDRKLAERPIEDPKAFEYYQRARREWGAFTPEGNRRAYRLAEAGLKLTGPNEAFFGLLGMIEGQAPGFGEAREPALARANDWAQQAFAINPNSARGHFVAGVIACRRGHVRKAARHLTQAADAGATDSDILFWLAAPLLLAGRLDRARAALRSAMEMDPLNSLFAVVMGFADLLDGDPSSGLTHLSRAIELDPLSVPARLMHSVTLVAAGRLDEALTHFDLLERHHHDNPLAASPIRLGKVLAGDRSAVVAPLSEDERTSTQYDESLSYIMSAAYAQAGETTEALRWLEHTVRDRGWIDYVFFTTHDRFLESLREEPRFKELMAYAREEYERVDV